MQDAGGTWLGAIRGLKDNPVYLYLRLAQRRRFKRVSWLKRNWLILLILALELVCVAYYVIQDVTVGALNSWRDLVLPAYWEQLAYILLLPVYSVWFCQGLFQAVLDALLVLAPTGRSLRLLILDDLCAVTRLTDRELAAGLLANLLPPLYWRIAAGAGLITAFAIDSAYNNSSATVFNDPAPATVISELHWPAVALAPLAFGSVLFTSALGTLALLLLMLALSRSMRPVLAACGAVLMVFIQIQYILTTSLMLPSMAYGMNPLNVNLVYIVLTLAGVPLLLFGVLSLCAYLSRISKGFRYVFAVGAPVFAAVVPLQILISIPLLMTVMIPMANPPDLTEPAYLSYLYSVGALSALSPLGIPGIFSLGAGVAQAASTVLQNMLLPPLLIALQLGLIWIFAREALLAICLRRHGVE